MAEGRVERRLAAILAADVAGYSRLMGADELGTLQALKVIRREIVDPAIASHRGRIVKTTGDGMLVEFASAVDAVTCAMAVQQKMAERDTSSAPVITFRIGINIGDIIIDGEDIFGDGVNVAARVENECEPGAVNLSASAYEQVRGKTSFAFEDLGERSLKNIDRPVRLYAVHTSAGQNATIKPKPLSTALPLPDKPSIAVLPFQNMSGDPEQEYFADGMVEDIITALSRLKSLFVIARNSSFTYKGQAIDIKRVGKELGVRYVLEGSVRKSSSKVRITGQLIEATTGAHLWADRFDGNLEDVFDLQDQVTERVVGAISPTLEQVEIERAKRKPTENLGAYDHYLRGLASFYRLDKEGNSAALAFFYKAIELDQSFAAAHGMAAWCHSRRKAQSWMARPEEEMAEGLRLAGSAADLGRDDALASCLAGMVFAYIGEQHERAAELMDRALSLNPNLGTVWILSGWVRAWRGESDIALEQLRMAMRLSPLDPLTYYMQAAMACAHFFAGRYDEASVWAEKSMREQPKFFPAIRFAAASDALAGRLSEANKKVTNLRSLLPGQRLSNLKDVAPFRRAEDFSKFKEGLKLAGLPD